MPVINLVAISISHTSSAFHLSISMVSLRNRFKSRALRMRMLDIKLIARLVSWCYPCSSSPWWKSEDLLLVSTLSEENVLPKRLPPLTVAAEAAGVTPRLAADVGGGGSCWHVLCRAKAAAGPTNLVVLCWSCCVVFRQREDRPTWLKF